MLMARLAQEDPTAHLLPGVDVRLANGTRGEIDVLGIHQQLLLAAEVKSSPGAYNRGEIVKDVARSQAIGADVHLMACLHRLNPGDIRVATEVASRAGIPSASSMTWSLLPSCGSPVDARCVYMPVICAAGGAGTVREYALHVLWHLPSPRRRSYCSGRRSVS